MGGGDTTRRRAEDALKDMVLLYVAPAMGVIILSLLGFLSVTVMSTDKAVAVLAEQQQHLVGSVKQLHVKMAGVEHTVSDNRTDIMVLKATGKRNGTKD